MTEWKWIGESKKEGKGEGSEMRRWERSVRGGGGGGGGNGNGKLRGEETGE